MPAPEQAWLLQTAVLWPATGGFDAYGQPTVGPPVEIPVRWLTLRQQRQSATGELYDLDAVAVAAERIDLGSRLWLGTLSLWYGSAGSGSAVADDQLMIVKEYQEAPDIKGRVAFREVGLMRFKAHG